MQWQACVLLDNTGMTEHPRSKTILALVIFIGIAAVTESANSFMSMPFQKIVSSRNV
jgi:hypothetical protein